MSDLNQQGDTPLQQKKIKGIGNLLLGVGIVLFIYAFFSSRPPKINLDAPPVEPVSAPPIITEQPESLPQDRLFITAERAAYQDGQLVLRIPRMGVDAAIQNGVTLEALDRGPGLYDYAQLPGEGIRNVSIAGHRDVAGALFYYIDRLGAGDLFYLIYNGKIYTYTYKDTKVVEKTDWSPIYPQEFSCLTITSCHPARTTRQRIIVTAELLKVEDYTSNYYCAPWQDGYDKVYVWQPGATTWTDANESNTSEASNLTTTPPSLGELPG